MMWLWTFIGLNFISKLHGYANGDFPEVCDSMRPKHYNDDTTEITPQTTEPPFMVSYQRGSNIGDPITVSLQRKGTFQFRGFMLEARDLSLDGNGPSLGKFIILDSKHTRLLNCHNSENSAVSNRLNTLKTLIQVNWTAEGEERDIVFRATFAETFYNYWERVNVTVLRPSTTPKPDPTTLPATTTRTTQMSTTEPLIPTTQIPTANATNGTTLLGITLMVVNSLLVEMKMQTPNIITAAHPTASSCHYSNKITRTASSSFSLLSSLSTLITFCLWNTHKVLPIGLLSVVVLISSIELVIAVLPFGPSHELNELCDLALRVCFPFHHLFTTIFLHVTVSSLIKEWEETSSEFWAQYVLIAFTVFIALTVVWDIVLCVKKKALLQDVRDMVRRPKGHRGFKEGLSAARQTVIVISAFLMAIITFLSVLLIVGLFWIQKNGHTIQLP